MNTRTFRAYEIDGIRGWCALIVVLTHAFGEMLKCAVPATRHTIFAPFFAGDLAVDIFFVLSGDALSVAYFAGGGTRIIDRLIVRRYLRLTIPIFMSCLLTYLIMLIGLDYHAPAALILSRPDWLGNFLQFSPSVVGLLKYSLLGVYTSHTEEHAYNPFLWTMSIEMVGSMLVFLVCLVWDRLRNPQLLCVILVVWMALLESYYCLFIAGILLGHLRRRGLFERLLNSQRHQFVAAAAIVVMGLILPHVNHVGNWYGARSWLWYGLAIGAVFCFYSQSFIKRFLSNGLSRFLGEISFPLYLVHFQVLISLMSWLTVRNHQSRDSIDHIAMLEFATIATITSFVAAWLFRQVERPAQLRAQCLVDRILL